MVSDSLGQPVPGPRILPFWATVPSATHTARDKKGEAKSLPREGDVSR